MRIQAFFDEVTFTLTYLVSDPATGDAVVIDPVLDYDPASSQTSLLSADRVTEAVREGRLRVRWILETHAHADHLSGAQILRRRFEAGVAIGARITEVQRTFKDVFHLGPSFATDGSQFDKLLHHGEVLDAGGLRVETIATPGHTPGCSTYRIADALFTGDALFIEDYGTGRCDFPDGSAGALYDSIHDRLYALPDEMRVFPGHDYLPNARALRYETTIGVEKERNVQLRRETARDEFIRFRTARDKTLSAPRLLFQSVQVNIAAGKLPRAADDGSRFLQVPINHFTPTDDAGDPAPRQGR